MKITEQYTKQPVQGNLSIMKAHYMGGFTIRLTFNDGSTKSVNFKPFLEHAKHPAITKYLDEEQFRNFNIKDGNLDWNDFDMCFPIGDLYRNSIVKKGKVTQSS